MEIGYDPLSDISCLYIMKLFPKDLSLLMPNLAFGWQFFLKSPIALLITF